MARNLEEIVGELIEDNELTKQQKMVVILMSGNVDVARACLNSDELGFDDWDRFYIVEALDDKSLKKEYKSVRNRISKLVKSEAFFEENLERIGQTKLSIPDDMTFGLEIECEGVASKLLLGFFRYKDWSPTVDGSIVDGVEIVSPILEQTAEHTKQIYAVTALLNKLGQHITEDCGGHIHIGANKLTSKQSYMNLLEIWCNTERILYAITNERGVEPRDAVLYHAPPISKKLHEAIKRGMVNIDNEGDLDEFIGDIQCMQESRLAGINFFNVNTIKNTLEFRLPNGSLSPETWIENVNLLGGIVQISEEITRIQSKRKKTEQDKHKIGIFKRLKQDIDEKEKLEILLELAGVEKEVYIARYNQNIDFFEEEPRLEEAFKEQETLDFAKEYKKITIGEIEEVANSSCIEQHKAMDEITEAFVRNGEKKSMKVK